MLFILMALLGGVVESRNDYDFILYYVWKKPNAVGVVAFEGLMNSYPRTAKRSRRPEIKKSENYFL